MKKYVALMLIFLLGCNLSVSRAEEKTLTIATNNYYAMMETMEQFEQESGIAITCNLSVDMMDTISTAYVIKNPDVDLFLFNTYDGLYTLKNMNYYAPLTDSEILQEAFAQVYPSLRSVCMDGETLMAWIVSASPMGMMVTNEYLDEWGMKCPETFDELLDVCNEILAEGLLPEETGLLMQKYTQSGMMDLFMKYYIMTSLQDGRRLDFTDETFLHYVQRIKDELPAEEEPRMAFENIFMIPGASSAPSQKIRFVPQIFPDQNSAVETYVTIGVVNPYAKNKEAAIQFLEYCATHPDDGSYFVYENLTEPIENPTVVTQMEETAAQIAQLEQKTDRECADEDKLLELKEKYANLETRRYLSSPEDIAYYQEMAKSLYVSEGSPLTYDDALQVLVQRYLNGAFDAATFAKECQNHVEMIYAEIGE